MVSLKKPQEIIKMRRAGKVVADVLRLMQEIIKPGVDTMSLDIAAENLLRDEDAKAAFKGYRVPGIAPAFPGSICVSVNDEVVHGMPNPDRFLQEGDIVSIDVGAVIDGYFGDAACTYPVGRISEQREKLLSVTREALRIGVEEVREGRTIGDIGHAIEEWTLSHGCGLVRNYAGHGIGKRLHEPPQVPNYGKAGTGMKLKAGLTICIEPMVMSGREAVKCLGDGWTVVTVDGSDAAHFEHAVLVTEDGVEILTPWE